MIEKLANTAAYKGAQQGALRGVANVIGYALDVNGFSRNLSQNLRSAVYFGGVFTFHYANYYNNLASQDIYNIEKIAIAVSQALLDTSSLGLTHLKR